MISEATTCFISGLHFATITDALSVPAQGANASAMPLRAFTLEIWANASDKKQFPKAWD